MNSWKSKWHDTCNARFTLSFSNQIQELIIENEARSKKECKKRYKLISFENEALFNTLNYQIICPSCHPSVSCPRHSHISYCTDTGPKPNPKAKNRMPLIRKKYLDREKKLKELLNEFHDLTFEDQMSKLEFYCTQFGLYTSDKEASDFGKVPEPSLSEIQEFQSASFLSFREVLNY